METWKPSWRMRGRWIIAVTNRSRPSSPHSFLHFLFLLLFHTFSSFFHLSVPLSLFPLSPGPTHGNHLRYFFVISSRLRYPPERNEIFHWKLLTIDSSTTSPQWRTLINRNQGDETNGWQGVTGEGDRKRLEMYFIRLWENDDDSWAFSKIFIHFCFRFRTPPLNPLTPFFIFPS